MHPVAAYCQAEGRQITLLVGKGFLRRRKGFTLTEKAAVLVGLS